MSRYTSFLTLLALTATAATAQTVPVQSMKGLAVPEPSNLSRFVTNKAAAIAMGKALFWDVQVSSDGKVACATCHFHAGSDMRLFNQMNPGTDQAFNATRTAPSSGPNYTVKPGDFPSYALSDPANRESTVLFETNDVMSSHGVFLRDFTSATPGAAEDACVDRADPVFNAAARNTRRTGLRNASTVINAVFNYRNFLDGRANHIFNGVDNFGPRNRNATVYIGSPAAATPVRIDNASLASQAVAPPVSSLEMSCNGRTWPEIGRRLLKALALKNQAVAADDSALAAYDAASGANGLRNTYEQLVQAAFARDLWSATNTVTVAGKSYTQAEANFALFFGLAVQLYEATLVSNDAPLDRYLAAYPATTVADSTALTSEEVSGLNIFRARCANCHGGPQLTNAGTPAMLRAQQGGAVDRMVAGDGNAGVYDFGFYNIGVRPTVADLGLGGTDPWGNPLSFTRQFRNAAPVDAVTLDACRFTVEPCTPLVAGFRDVVDGAIKTPTLRNLALTGPYLHDGSLRTIEEVVEFYARGGNRRGSILADTTGHAGNASNLADGMNFTLAPFEKQALVAFLKNALTDQRVRWERAPFDHPELPLVQGNDAVLVPAVGSAGRTANPLRTFEEIAAAGTLGYPAAGETNLARGRAAVQTSTDYNAPASRAVDGSRRGNFFDGSVTHTARDTQPYWQLDLGAVADVSRIVIYNRTDCCASRLSNFHVYTSESPISGRWSTQAKYQRGVSDYDFPGTAGATVTINVNKRARYIRVQLDGINYLSLAEVEVIGRR